jgi:hypothetical protein
LSSRCFAATSLWNSHTGAKRFSFVPFLAGKGDSSQSF